MGSGGIWCARCRNVFAAILVAAMATGEGGPNQAREFHARYLGFCDDCIRAGIPPPAPEQWVEIIEAEVLAG